MLGLWSSGEGGFDGFARSGEERDGVLLMGALGKDAELVQELEHRDLRVLSVNRQEIPKYVAFVRAILYPYASDCASEIRKLISKYRLLNHGLLILIVHADNESGSAEAKFAGMNKASHDRVKIVSNRHPYRVAQLVSAHSPGPSENTGVEVSGTDNKDLIFLIRRAFSDCDSVRLERLNGGFAAQTYRAEVITKGLEGAAPLPFFVKYDAYSRIETERNNYQRFVENYLPFNHRPNLAYERCVMGDSDGILVGNFVENSVSLGSVAWGGTVNSAVHSLFKGALRGWRQQAFYGPNLELSGEFPVLSIIDSLEMESRHTIFKDDIDVLEVAACAESLGLTTTYRDLTNLVRRFPKVRHLRGPIHRDLHTSNVHIHGVDAILLDFYSVEIGPLLWDPALLDASLMFDAWEADPYITNEGWMAAASDMYSVSALEFSLRPKAKREFLGPWDAIQEIRLYANGLQLDKGSYMQALVIALLRIAAFSPKSEVREVQIFRKAYALCIAERYSKVIMGGEENA